MGDGDVSELGDLIEREFSFLLDDGRFHAGDARTSPSFGGDACVEYCSNAVCFRFIRHRRQLFLDVARATETKSRDWYSIDLVWRLVTGEPRVKSVVDETYATFVNESLQQIETLFDDGHWGLFRVSGGAIVWPWMALAVIGGCMPTVLGGVDCPVF